MSKRILALFSAIMVLAVVLAGCGGGTPATEEPEPTAPPEPTEAPAAGPALAITGDVESEMEWTRDELEAMDTMTVEYTRDDETTEYTGVPMNALLDEAGVQADAGTVVFVADDGYEAEVDLAEVRGCDNCIVAFDDDSLRSILPEFPSNMQVKFLIEIKIEAGEAAEEPEPTEPPEPAEAALAVTGSVESEMEWTREELEAMDTMAVEVTRDDETTEYTGVSICALLDEAGVQEGATTVVFVADDGYEAEVDWAELQGCDNCIVAFDDDSLRSVLPEFPGNVQVKYLVEIKIQ